MQRETENMAGLTSQPPEHNNTTTGDQQGPLLIYGPGWASAPADTYEGDLEPGEHFVFITSQGVPSYDQDILQEQANDSRPMPPRYPVGAEGLEVLVIGCRPHEHRQDILHDTWSRALSPGEGCIMQLECGCMLESKPGMLNDDLTLLTRPSWLDRRWLVTVTPTEPTDEETFLHAAAEILAASIQEGMHPEKAVMAMHESLEQLVPLPDTAELLRTRAAITRPQAIQNLYEWVDAAMDRAAQLGSHIGLTQAVRLMLKVVLHGASEITHAAETIVIAFVDLVDRFLPVRAHDDLMHLLDVVNAVVEHINPGFARRPKAAWAPLFERDTRRWSEAQRFYMGLPVMEATTDVSLGALQERIAQINERAVAAGLTTLPDVPQIRRTHRPKKPCVSFHEPELSEALRATQYSLDPIMSARAKAMEKEGIPLWIDGMWNAETQQRLDSLARYYEPRVVMGPGMREKAALVAEAMYQRAPEAYRDPIPTMPSATLALMEKNYSPGLPFIGFAKKRRDIMRSGHMQVIMDMAVDILKSGVYPDVLVHVFTKEYVGSKVRTVTATELLDNFIANTAQLEWNKRPVWRATWRGSGMPLTEKAMGPVFSAMNKRKTVRGTDFTAADSTFSEMGFEIQNQLFERALGDAPYKAQMAAVFRAAKLKLQFKTLVDLETGEVSQSQRGAATGQSATSQDNSRIVEGVVIDTWSEVTGRDPRSFYETNTFANASDDNEWGTDDDFDFDEFRQVMLERHGMICRLEWEGKDKHQYLGRRGVPSGPYEETYRVLGEPIPDMSVIADVKRLASRRSALKARWQRSDSWTRYSHGAETLAGHAALMGHLPDEWQKLHDQWLENAAAALVPTQGWHARAMAARVEKNLPTHDKFGRPIPVLPLRADCKYKGPQYSWWVKHAHMPTYEKVCRDHLTEAQEISPRQLKKYLKVHQAPDTMARLGDTVSGIREGLYAWLPNSVLKLAPTVESMPLSYSFTTGSYVVENFCWLAGGQQDCSVTAQQLRASPYSTCIDTTGWQIRMLDPSYREDVTSKGLRYWRRKTLAITGCYLLILQGIKAGKQVPLLGECLQVFELYQSDLPRLYAALSTTYWHASGKSSAVVSAMIPRDPYTYQKQLAYALADIYDLGLLEEPFGDVIGFVGPLAVELLTQAYSLRNPGMAREVHHRPVENRWGSVIHQVFRDLTTGSSPLLLASVTGSGKSTAGMAAAIEHGPQYGYYRFCLAMPTRLLVETYTNDWTARHHWQQLGRGIHDLRRPLVIATYGHLLQRCKSDQGLADSVLFADEVQTESPEMVVLLSLWRGPIVYLTATPSFWNLAAPVKSLDTGFKPRFKIEHVPYVGDTATKAVELQQAGATKRALIIVESQAQAMTLADQLTANQQPATAVTAKQRDIPAHGWIVATAVARQGLTIEPPVTVVISCGRTKIVTPFESASRWTNQAEMLQEAGRTGRSTDGTYYYPMNAGTSPFRPPLPGLAMISNHRQAFHRLQVVEIGLPRALSAPTRMDLVLPDLRNKSEALTRIYHLLFELVSARPLDWISAYTALYHSRDTPTLDEYSEFMEWIGPTSFLAPSQVVNLYLRNPPAVQTDDGSVTCHGARTVWVCPEDRLISAEGTIDHITWRPVLLQG